MAIHIKMIFYLSPIRVFSGRREGDKFYLARSKGVRYSVAKKVFFSFHYQDVIDFRANVVRQHWVTKPNREEAGYFDKSIWEEAKKKGDIALKRMINNGLDNTSNTCVLIGSQTHARPWVRYEILKSFVRGNHILGVHINGIKDKNQSTKTEGPNPFEYLGVRYSDDGKKGTILEYTSNKWIEYTEIDGIASFQANVSRDLWGNGYKLSAFYKCYDWAADNGYSTFPNWLK
jgi:hypothetical protein